MTLLRWLTFLFGSRTVNLSPALLDLFLSSDASIYSTMAFSPLGNLDHIVVSVSIDFPSQRDVPFHFIAYDCSGAEWDSLRDHWRGCPCGDISKLDASAAASEFCEWVQIGIDIYVPQRKYSTAQRCCLLYLIKQNSLQKTFLRTPVMFSHL